MPLGSEEAQAEALLWFLGDSGGYLNSSGAYAINSAQNVHALDFIEPAGQGQRYPAEPGQHGPQDVWASFAQGRGE